MNFAQVCGAVVTCAVTAFVGCGGDREAVDSESGSPTTQVAGAVDGRAAPPGRLRATDLRAATQISTPATIDLIADRHAAQSGALVVSGIGAAAHGKITVLGGQAIYTPTPGYVGADSFRYTVTDAAGQVSSGAVALEVAAATPSCTIAISGSSPAVRGPALHLTSTPSCNFGTPEIQWQHRVGTSGTFSTFKNFSTDTTADFTTTGQSLGIHEFRARVRIQGTTPQFTSNTLDVTLVNNTSPCTAVVLDAPAGGAVFATGQPIALHGTATCPAGVTPEYQYLVRQATDTAFTPVSGTFSAGTNYTPAQAGGWVFGVAVRAQGSTGAFQLQSSAVAVTVSHAPTASDDALVLDEDTSGTVNVLANDSDPDGDPLTATITTPPAGGTATIAAGVVTYRPAANYNGTDSIGYTVSDGHGNTATAAVHVTINPVEDPPSAHHDFVTVAEDGSASVDVTLNDTDPDGDTLTVIGHSPPANGTVTFTGNVATYVPNSNFTGQDTFEYTIDDGHGVTSTAGVFVTVTASNDAPTANDDQLTTPEDTEGDVDLLANDSDPEHDPLTVVSFTQPTSGTVTLTGSLASYVPAANYNGQDSFRYTVRDPSGATASATVHITVLAVNDPPTASPDTANTDEDTAVTIDVVANDRDVDVGDVLTVTRTSAPANGTVAIVSGHEVVYTPAADYNGPDSFTYTISDVAGATATATVTIAVAAVNDLPHASSDSVSVDEDTTGTFDVVANDSDVDHDALTITEITQPTNGTAALVDATHVSYTPAPNYNGPDSFSYTISDGHGGLASAAISVTVSPVNDAPSAAPDGATTDEDTAVTIDVAANDSDIDHDALTVAAVGQPSNGTAAIADATHVTYTPAPDYNGPDSFSYTISDGHGGTSTATVSVAVRAVNDPPVARADAASLDEDTAATIDVVANDSDVDHDALTVTAVGAATSGAVTIVDAHHVAYVPAPDYNGPDSFSYTISDPSGLQATAQVSITVNPVNDPPVAHDDAATLDEDTAITVDVVGNDFDIDRDALAITSITQPTSGIAIAIDGQHVRYIPAPDYNGPDSLTYTISDGHGGTASAVLRLTVNAINDAPVAADDAATLDEDTAATIDVVANDHDVDHDTLAVASVTQPANGTAAISGLHTVSYTPAPDYNGSDSFSYTIDDGHGGQATAQVSITVNPVNDPPVAADDAAALDEDTSATIDVVSNDRDVDHDPLTVSGVTQPRNGAAAVIDAHHVSYAPAANYNGSDSFSYTIIDGHGGQATAQVSITVNPVNDPPVATAGALSTFDDTPAAAVLTGSDIDGDSLVFAIAAGPQNGSLGAVTGNRVTYTPAAGFVGTDSFSFVASDGRVSSAPATITVTVVRSVCGNGVREGVHEECDDGNATPADGCEASCRLTCGSGTGADRDAVDPASGHCFAAYDGVQHSYQQAAAMCTALGGHLPTITSASEDAAAFAAVRSGDAPWLGASDIAAEGAFSWVTGEAFGYSHFHAGKPDNAGGADCVHYLSDGTWSDAVCAGSGVTGTLCELELATTTPAFPSGGTGTRAVAVADLNGDGYADIAAVNPASNTVGVLLGDGAGGFSLVGTYPTGTGPVAVAAADFDGDGVVDLAVVNAGGNTLGILHGTGGGGFTTGASVAIAASATAVVAADLTGDGTLDLAVTASSGILGGTVQVLRGNGAGGFTVQTSLSIAGALGGIAVGDFNRDGAIDLALTTPTAVLVVTGAGGGGFNAPLSLAVTTGGNRQVVVADLDGDGNLDLAVANGATSVLVFFGNPLGVFTTATTLTLLVQPQLLVAADFDGDGATDLVALGGNVATTFHAAGRTLTAATALVTTGGAGASFAAVANVNGDGIADLVVANPTSSNVGVLLGSSTGLVGARGLPAGTGATAIVTGDFDEDGRSDLAVVDPGTSKVYVYLQSRTGALVPGPVVSTTINPAVNVGSTYAVVADFDGDTHLDLAVVNVLGTSVSVLLGTGTGSFGAPMNVGVNAGPRRPVVGDFNGDNKPDLAVPCSGATANNVAILINTFGGHFGRAPVDPAVTGAPSAVAVGEFTGDTKKDLVVISGSEASVKLLAGRGDINASFAAAVAFPVAAPGQAIAVGDIDGDSKLDVIATGANSLSVLRGNGAGGFAAATTIAVGSQPSSVVATDLDGDNRLDLVVGNAGTNDVTVLHNAGGGSFVGTNYALGVPTSWVCVADFDRDGHPDIAAAAGTSFAAVLYSPR